MRTEEEIRKRMEQLPGFCKAEQLSYRYESAYHDALEWVLMEDVE